MDGGGLSMTDMVAEAMGATVSFHARRGGDLRALRSVNLAIARGESLAVVGESGSGKTTLLRLLLALVTPSEGDVALFGRSLSECSPDELISFRRRCGYVPQDPYGSLPPTISVLDAAAEPFLVVHGRDLRENGRERASRILADLGLGEADLLKSRVRTSLSGGQRQRVAIARALVLDPELLLADEPTGMQDASTRGDVLKILKKRVSRGMTMIFVTHDLLLARGAARRTMVLHGGTVCEYGPSDLILNEPLHPYTMALQSALPRLGRPMVPSVRKGGRMMAREGCPFRSLCPEAMFVCGKAPHLSDAGNGRKVACWARR